MSTCLRLGRCQSWQTAEVGGVSGHFCQLRFCLRDKLHQPEIRRQHKLESYLARRLAFLAALRRAFSYFFIAFRCFFDIFFSTFCCCLASFRDRRIFSAVVVRWACAGIDAATPKAASSRMKVAICFITVSERNLAAILHRDCARRAHRALLL